MLAASDSCGSGDVHADSAPFAVACLVGRPVGKTVNGAKIGDNAFIGSGQVLKPVDFIEHTATYFSHLAHPLVALVKSFRLRVERTHRLIFGVEPHRIE